ncbi:MAG: hypothetical protein KC621_04480, partial [Myxococcales bacterium]|nr:hypothetical protein [Myxococcales bacterium]
MRLIRELADLGPCEVVCDIAELPALDSLDAEEVFLSWVLHLRAPVERALIDDVFAWVEDDCDFAIVALVSESAAEPSPGELSPPPEAVPVAAAPSAPAISAEPAEAAPRERRAASTDAGSIRVAIDKIDDLINKVGELVITQSML